MKYSKADTKQALENLREWMPVGSTVYTILRSVSKSGMTRKISLVVIKDGYTLHPNYAAATVLGCAVSRVGGRDCIRVDGCGMDMGFDLVYQLSHKIHAGKGMTDAGYALKQSWL